MLRGLQCSEVEADTSKHEFTGLQLNHETGLLSLEATRVWWLRLGLEFACPRFLTGDQVAKLIGHITWSCLLRRPALSLVNAGYRFARTFGPRGGWVWPAVAQVFRGIATLLPLLNYSLPRSQSPWVYATDASGGVRRGHGATRRRCDLKEVAAAVVECERRPSKALWLGVTDARDSGRVDLHPSLAGSMQVDFQSLIPDRAVFENVPSFIIHPKAAWTILFGGVWRKPLEILRGDEKAHGMALRHACRSRESLGKQILFLLDDMAMVLGASKGRGSGPSVVALTTFTIPVCR